MSSKQLNHAAHLKIPNGKDYAWRTPTILSTSHVVLRLAGIRLNILCQRSRSNQEGPTLFGWRACSSPEQPCCRSIAPGDLLDLRPRSMWRFEHGGSSRPTPFSASIHCSTRGLGEIRMGFSLLFIGHVVCISASTSIIDLHPGDLLRQSEPFDR